MTILTNTPSTAKEKREHFLLVAIHFACLMCREANPMDSALVQKRIKALYDHLYHNHPSQLFDKLYINCAGKLGSQFVLRVNSSDYRITIWRADNCSNVLPMYQQRNAVA
ncbi:hypothetical protein [Shewanella sp.]|uniref:hypothetical protein n=1 Tax=Shewanella sp. TaxID=50422 RepID=UPI003D0D35C5